MRQKVRKIAAPKKGKPKLALIVSRFNESICEGLLSGALKKLSELGYTEKDYFIERVPGAFEIPLAAQQWGTSKKVKGILCLGAVIRGDTPHFDYVCEGVTHGLMRVMLDCRIPLGFGVLTTNDSKQALARASDDDYNKGRECAVAVLEMIEVLNR